MSDICYSTPKRVNDPQVKNLILNGCVSHGLRRLREAGGEAWRHLVMIWGVSSIHEELPPPPLLPSASDSVVASHGNSPQSLPAASMTMTHRRVAFPRSPGWDVVKQRVESGPVLCLYRNIFYKYLYSLSPKHFASGTIIHP